MGINSKLRFRGLFVQSLRCGLDCVLIMPGIIAGIQVQGFVWIWSYVIVSMGEWEVFVGWW